MGKGISLLPLFPCAAGPNWSETGEEGIATELIDATILKEL
jgi:hypothetical protein